MDAASYRQSDNEISRTQDLMRIVSGFVENAQTALDIGARDGHFSRLFTEYFSSVTALDLEKPEIPHDNIDCIKGDLTSLQMQDNSFDFVFCSEVLEHIPTEKLHVACGELARVTKRFLLVGVPFDQDIRLDQTTCLSCERTNPPWGHVNSFDTQRLYQLFSSLHVRETSFVGLAKSRTNFLSAWLMNLAMNPYGTYEQDERCIYCGNELRQPSNNTLINKLMRKSAVWLRNIQLTFSSPKPIWVHILFEKEQGSPKEKNAAQTRNHL